MPSTCSVGMTSNSFQQETDIYKYNSIRSPQSIVYTFERSFQDILLLSKYNSSSLVSIVNISHFALHPFIHETFSIYMYIYIQYIHRLISANNYMIILWDAFIFCKFS